jgi:hypothetical protein
MTRREMFKAITGVAAAVGCGGLVSSWQKYGPITVQRWMSFKRRGVYLHVFHQGKDVTTNCCYADDTGEGVAELYLRDGNGHAYRAVDGGIAKQVVHGVTIREGDAL